MTLIAELNQMNHDRDKMMIAEKSSPSNSALLYLKSERVASILRDAGMKVSVDNIAAYGFMSVTDVEDAIAWRVRGKNKALSFEIDSQSSPLSTLAVVEAGLLWIESRSKSKRGNKPIPPSDLNPIGVQRVMLLTGLGRVEILETIRDNGNEIASKFPDFRPSWVNDSKEVLQQNAKNQHPDTKVALIRQAVVDIAQGRLGMVTSEMLAKWSGGRIGLGGRQIDKLLQTSPELRDLDKYRAAGTRYKSTDADREAAYQRNMNK